MVKRHNTKWAVCASVKHKTVVYFSSLEDAKAYAYEHGWGVYPPIYG